MCDGNYAIIYSQKSYEARMVIVIYNYAGAIMQNNEQNMYNRTDKEFLKVNTTIKIL